jgi:hypothetical protein
MAATEQTINYDISNLSYFFFYSSLFITVEMSSARNLIFDKEARVTTNSNDITSTYVWPCLVVERGGSGCLPQVTNAV